jgi:hypothetical protein
MEKLSVDSAPSSDYVYLTRTDGVRVLRLRHAWSPVLAEQVRQRQFDVLTFASGEWGNFEFLRAHVEDVERIAVYAVADSYQGLEHLRKLKSIHLESIGITPVALDRLAQLEVATLYWTPSYANALASLPVLENLSIAKYSGKNLAALGSARNLRKLTLSQGGLAALEGVQGLCFLEELRLFRLRSLIDVSALQQAKSLRILEIDGARKLENIHSILGLSAIEDLRLMGTAATLPDLAGLAQMPHLRSLTSDAVVERVDFGNILLHKSLERVDVLTTQHLSGFNDVLSAAAKKNNVVVSHVQVTKHRGMHRVLLEIVRNTHA